MDLNNLKSSSYNSPKYRADIDGLRALAVLAVVAFHASPMQMKGGFIGVDIFFVISGFLISSILFQNLQQNNFSFAEFYARRIKRIFPALLTVLISCFLFGWIALYGDEYQQLGKHLVGGGGFLANFLLWQESGYFDSAAESKPLLHLWSLGIEEQFYIVCPFLLWFLAKKRITPLIPLLSLLGISFFLNLKGVYQDPVAAFYSPQTRFWELLIGVLLAYCSLHDNNSKFGLKISRLVNPRYLSNMSSLIGLALIFCGFLFISATNHFPGVWALIPTIGTALIIGAGAQAWVNRHVFSNKVMVWIGLISFPLYLWHWPLLSFIHIINNGNDASRITRIFAVLCAILLAWLTYEFIEKPVRYGHHKNTRKLLFTSVLLMVTGFTMYQSGGYTFRPGSTAKQKAWTDKIQTATDYEHSEIYRHVNPNKIRDFYLFNTPNNQAEIAIIGDSHANRLYWALSSYKKIKALNVGRGTCPPLIDVEVFQKDGQSLECQPLTNNYLHYVKNDPHIKLIIINAFYNQYKQGLALKANNKPISLEDALSNTLNYLENAQKKIIVALDVPEIPGSCYQRNFPIWNSKVTPVCTVSKNEFATRNESLLKTLSLYSNISIFNPEATFCKEQCGEIDQYNYLYLRDGNHLNDFGLAKLSSALYNCVRKELG